MIRAALLALTLASSGAISVYDIADEFGIGRNSTWPGAFYGLGGAPGSGALALQDFYGRSNVVFTPDGGAASASAVGKVSRTLSCNKAATWTFSLPAGVTASIASGASATSVTFSYQAGDDSTASFNAQGVSGSVSRSFSVSLTSRSASGVS